MYWLYWAMWFSLQWNQHNLRSMNYFDQLSHHRFRSCWIACLFEYKCMCFQKTLFYLFFYTEELFFSLRLYVFLRPLDYYWNQLNSQFYTNQFKCCLNNYFFRSDSFHKFNPTYYLDHTLIFINKCYLLLFNSEKSIKWNYDNYQCTKEPIFLH